MAIMFKIVYPHLESAVSEFVPQLGRDWVTSFRDKIKGRAKSKFRLEVHQGPALAQACFALNIVRENKGKFFALRPTCPVFRRTLRSWHNRPDVPDALA